MSTGVRNRLPTILASCAVLVACLCLLGGCGRSPQSTQAGTPPKEDSHQDALVGRGRLTGDDAERDRAIRDAMARADQAAEERLRNPPTNEVPLPNYDAGPGRPRPLGRNFYEMDNRYPGYLLCQYDVNEKSYDAANEPEWLQEALLQVRSTGRNKFPPIKWVAVAIFNRADHKGAATFESCFKAGAIFDANDVFNLEGNLSNLVVHATIDRHPFKYDRAQPTPGDQQRWLIVERHAGNHADTAPQRQ